LEAPNADRLQSRVHKWSDLSCDFGIAPTIVAGVPQLRHFLFGKPKDDGTREQPVPLATATLGAIAGLSSAALALALFWFFAPIQGSIPRGTVIASTEGCDTQHGWQPFNEGTGRTIIGAGDVYAPGYDYWYRQLGGGKTEAVELKDTPFKVMRPGGEISHRLTIEEIPSHDHAFEILDHSDYERSKDVFHAIDMSGRDDKRTPIPNLPNPQHRFTELVGGGKDHNILPPYVPLYYCKKD
jgi:hypothetical protein